MKSMLLTHTLLCLFIALNVLIGITECMPVQTHVTQKKPTLDRKESLRTQFLQDIRPKDTSKLSIEGKKQVDHIFEKRPDTPRKSRVAPEHQAKYTLLRQQEQTFGRIGNIGKETIGNAKGKEKVTVHLGGGLSGHFSQHAGREADRLARPLSPTKAGNRGH